MLLHPKWIPMFAALAFIGGLAVQWQSTLHGYNTEVRDSYLHGYNDGVADMTATATADMDRAITAMNAITFKKAKMPASPNLCAFVKLECKYTPKGKKP